MSKPYVDMDKEDGSAWSTDGIPCPYCGYVHCNDLFEIKGAYTEDGGETECSNCEKDFTFSAFIRYSWTGRKKEDA